MRADKAGGRLVVPPAGQPHRSAALGLRQWYQMGAQAALAVACLAQRPAKRRIMALVVPLVQQATPAGNKALGLMHQPHLTVLAAAAAAAIRFLHTTRVAGVTLQ